MRLLFVHGWGFDSGVWRELAPLLPHHDANFVDLGFIKSRAAQAPSAEADTVVIGHSLGVMWTLKHMEILPKALVSICGFARFSPPVPRAMVEKMSEGLARKPLAQMKHFWRSCGIEPFADADDLDAERLAEGLDWLRDWDADAELQRLDCPRLVLAARDDQVVNEDMSTAQWGGDAIVWSKDGGHGLPLTQPQWCAQQIGAFLDRL